MQTGELQGHRIACKIVALLYAALSDGHSGLVSDAWILTSLLPAIAIISFVVIPREERYLEARFGEEYATYKASVRRWL